METEIIFATKKLKNQYESLKDSSEFKFLYKSLTRAFGDIMDNPGIGVPLKKYRIPRDLLKRGIDNLYKYDLPGAWRLIYSVGGKGVKILALILEWCDHDTYKKKYSGRRK